MKTISRRDALGGAAGLAAAALAGDGAAAAPGRAAIPYGSAAQSETFREDARYREALKRYCDVIVNRWQTFTGLEARLDGDGRTFAEVAQCKAA